MDTTFYTLFWDRTYFQLLMEKTVQVIHAEVVVPVLMVILTTRVSVLPGDMAKDVNVSLLLATVEFFSRNPINLAILVLYREMVSKIFH